MKDPKRLARFFIIAGLLGWNVNLELRIRKLEAVQAIATQAVKAIPAALNRLIRKVN